MQIELVNGNLKIQLCITKSSNPEHFRVFQVFSFSRGTSASLAEEVFFSDRKNPQGKNTSAELFVGVATGVSRERTSGASREFPLAINIH
jgi:hypothetical protein